MDLFELLIPVLLSLVAAVVLKQIFVRQWGHSYLPGPWGLPLVGNLIQLGREPHKTLMRWKKTYGPIVSVQFGSFPSIAISDYKILRKVFSDQAFSGRPDIETFKHRSGGARHGILFGDGSEWHEQRRFTIKHLRELGVGRSRLEATLQNEISEVLDLMSQANANAQTTGGSHSESQAMLIKPFIAVAVINSLWVIITGERFRHGDALVHKMLSVIQENLEKFNGLSALAMFMPWFTRAFPEFSGFNEMTKDLGGMLAFLNVPIDRHRAGFVHGSSRDFIDAYLNEMHNCTDKASSFHRDNVPDLVLQTVCLDLFTAGAETTTTTISWICLYLAVLQDVQEKVHAELDSVVGRNRMVALGDKGSLPYLEAVTQEALRYTTVVPTGLFKSTLADVTLEGYWIPKNTMVVTNLYDAHFDEEYWGDPQVFRPERWLDTGEDGKQTVRKHDAFFPFLAGRRSCLGEELARSELFIFCSNLFQRFSIETDPNNPNPTLEPIVSTVCQPQAHKLVFKERASI